MVTVHEWLTAVSSPSVRLLVTAVALAVVAAGWLAVRALRRRVDGSLVARGVTLLVLGGFLALVAGAVAAVLSVWGLYDETRRFLETETGRSLAVRAGITVAGLAGAYVLVGVSRRLIDEFVESRLSLSSHEGEVLFRAVQITLYAVTLVWLLSVWRLGLTNLLISAGVLGVVLGLAAQQTLGAVIAGFVIMLSRPFEVGDYVRVGDREGTVTDVTLVATRLRTLDREHVSIPNDVVESGEVVNYSRDGRLRVHAGVTVDYDADVERAADVATDAVADLDIALDRPDPDYDATFDDSGVTLDVRFFIDDPTSKRRWHAHRDAVVAIRTAFEEAGIAIPFPQRELSARDGQLRVASDPDGEGSSDDSE